MKRKGGKKFSGMKGGGAGKVFCEDRELRSIPLYFLITAGNIKTYMVIYDAMTSDGLIFGIYSKLWR